MLIILILVTFVTYIYLKWIQLKQFWAKQQVPHTPPHPILGSMTFLLNENPAVWLRRIYNYSKESYMGIWIFWRPGLIINSTEIARNILIKDQANFRNRFTASGVTDPIGHLNLFTTKDPIWTVIRKRLSILFTGSKLKGLQQITTKKSKELVERIERDRQKSKLINLRHMMTDYSTDIIGTSSFGVVSDAVLYGTGPMKRITEGFMTFSIFRALSWYSIFFMPELVDIFRFKLFPTECTEYMRKILREMIAQRGGLENQVTEPKDLLDILIKIKQEGGKELDMTENMMLAQAAAFIQGGFDTTATVLSFTIYELAFHPAVQEKLTEELHEAKEKYGDDLLEARTLSQLTYLNCVIYEGLRKYPILNYIDRVALANYKVDEKLTIRAGTPVYINIIGIHYDPKLYPEPDTFNPDRFLLGNKVTNSTLAFMPFGEGPRKCIAQRFGLSFVRHALTAIILSYEVRPLPNTPKPTDVPLEKKVLTTIPGEVLSVDFIPRTTT